MYVNYFEKQNIKPCIICIMLLSILGNILGKVWADFVMFLWFSEYLKSSQDDLEPFQKTSQT